MLIDLLSIVGLYLGFWGLSSECLFSCKALFDNVVRFFGVPAKIISKRDPRCTTSQW